MKTNTNQVHKKRSTARTALQTKTFRNLQPPAVNGRPASAEKPGVDENGGAALPDGGANISFMVEASDEFLASVAISAGQLTGLKRRAADSGLSLGGFVLQGLDRVLAELEGKTDVHKKANAVNEVVVQSNVLMELIENHLDYRENRSGEDFSGKRADTFNYGLALLTSQIRSQLQEATDELMAAAYQNNWAESTPTLAQKLVKLVEADEAERKAVEA